MIPKVGERYLVSLLIMSTLQGLRLLRIAKSNPLRLKLAKDGVAALQYQPVFFYYPQTAVCAHHFNFCVRLSPTNQERHALETIELS